MNAMKATEKRAQDLEEFKTCVRSLINGIYRLDKVLQQIIDIGDVSHNTALFIMRSSQDLLSLISIYKDTKYFHKYMELQLTSTADAIRETMALIETKSKRLIMIKENYEMSRQQLKEGTEGEFLDGDMIEDVSRKLFEATLLIRELVFEIKTDYRDYRYAIHTLRGLISNDYIAIISGIDIPLLYEDYETLVHNHMSQEVLFDIDGIRRELTSKGGKIHE